MKIHTFDQGSAQWEEIRKGKITASQFANLITPSNLKISNSVSAHKTISKIIASKIAFRDSDSFETYSMANGIECEPRARFLYQEIYHKKVKEVGFIEDETGYAGFSPDGLIDDGMIEIKTQCQKEHFYCKLYGFDCWLSKYKPQILFSMAINNEIQWCDCISYNEDFKDTANKIIVHRYYRDEEEIAKIRIAINYWIEHLKEKSIEIGKNIERRLSVPAGEGNF